MSGALSFDHGTATVVLTSPTVNWSVHAGEGGAAVASGTRSGLFEIEIVGNGEVGAATYKWRHRNGAWQVTCGGACTTGADVELTKDDSTASGQHVQFTTGVGGGDDFSIGDALSFTPVLEVTSNHQAVTVTVPLVTPPDDWDTVKVTSSAFGASTEFLYKYAAKKVSATTGDPVVSADSPNAGWANFSVENLEELPGGDPLNGTAKFTVMGLL